MTGVRVEEVDVDDDPQYAAFHAAYREGQRHGLGDLAPTWTAPELRVALGAGAGRFERAAYVARSPSGEVLGTSQIGMPLLDNVHRAEVVLDVRPEHRRRGVGMALLTHLERVARSRGRRRLVAEAVWPWQADPGGAGAPGVAFGLALGWSLDQVEVRRELALPPDPDVLARLTAEAAPHHTAYRLESWTTPVPDHLAEGWLRLTSQLMTQAPNPDADAEPETLDVEALREREATLAAQGRQRVATVALDGAGEVVAYTDLVVTEHEPDRCYQWGTLVRPDHRGHRLGLAVKVANLTQLAETAIALSARELTTFNAESNHPMVAINEQLGFVPVARLGELTRRVGPPD